MILSKCEQGSDEWFMEKLGKPSASNADKIITGSGKKSTQREGYLYELAAERVRGYRDETFKNEAMEMGNIRENESLIMYEMALNCYVESVGVVYKDEHKKFLCSPDGIVNGQWGVECKNVLGKTQVKRLLKWELPAEYVMQVQFSLYITGFDRWDFCSYCPDMRPLIIQVEPDKKLQSLIDEEIHAFCDDLERITKEIS